MMGCFSLLFSTIITNLLIVNNHSLFFNNGGETVTYESSLGKYSETTPNCAIQTTKAEFQEWDQRRKLRETP